VHWNGKLAAGKTMEVRTVMGTVRAVAATDDIAAIDATVSPTANGDSNTSMRVREDDHGVLLRTERDDDDRCGDHGQHVQPVDVVVRVPAGVRLVVHTVDARIDADGLKGTAVLHTVDGTIDARGLSSVEAGTVDGSIHVAFAQPDLAEDTVVSTVNGTVDVTLPPTENAELAASTVNGLIRVDMPPSGVESSHRLRLTLGHGGRSLRLRTVNGAIHVKRAS